MNELVISRTQQLDNPNITLTLLQDFYKNIDVQKETIRTYKKGINNFIQWIKNNGIQPIDKKAIISYKQYLIDTYSNTTASTYFSGVRNLFNFLEEYGIPNITRNIKGIKVSREFRKQPLTKEQAIKIKESNEQELKTLKQLRDYTIYCLLLYNGLREIELNRANKDDITMIDGKHVLMIQGKGKLDKSQYAVLTDSVLIPLLAYLDMRGEDNHKPLFIGLASNKYGTRLTTKSISRIIKTMLVNNGYKSKKITAHSLRHTTMTSALNGGATLQETQELARHSNINTTLIYSHNIERIKNAPEYYVEKYLNSNDNKGNEVK